MSDRPTCYLSPKVEARPLTHKGLYGVFAREAVAAGEVVVMWAGSLCSFEALRTLSPLIRSWCVQVDDDLYLVPVAPGEPADFVNHSCNPNVGVSGQIALVAMRDIRPGEEVCYDYAMTDGSAYDEFDCGCGEAACRGRITGEDWRRPELQARYRGYFSPYLQRRIDRATRSA